MKKIILQKLVLPVGEKMQNHWEIFYRGPRAVILDSENCLMLSAGQAFDFATYMSGLAYNKWSRYTNLGEVSLTISIQGEFILNLTGYSNDPTSPVRHEYLHQQFSNASRQDITVSFPKDIEEEFIAFELLPISHCYFYGGFYSSDFEQNDIREVNIAIATTTCHKEQFIIHNIQMM